MGFGEPIGRVEVEVREGRLKNGKAAGKDEITGEMIKGEGDRMENWIRKPCYMTFERSVVPQYWRFAVIVLLYMRG